MLPGQLKSWFFELFLCKLLIIVVLLPKMKELENYFSFTVLWTSETGLAGSRNFPGNSRIFQGKKPSVALWVIYLLSVVVNPQFVFDFFILLVHSFPAIPSFPYLKCPENSENGLWKSQFKVRHLYFSQSASVYHNSLPKISYFLCLNRHSYHIYCYSHIFSS